MTGPSARHFGLWKYLGSKEVGDGPVVKRVSLLPPDRLVLCTKGVHGTLSDEQILAVAGKRGEAQKCADDYQKMVNEIVKLYPVPSR